MALWVVRAGRHGDEEAAALDSSCVVVGWDKVSDLSQYASKAALATALTHAYPDRPAKGIEVWTNQLWTFKETISKGDLVALPLKSKGAVAFGRVAGVYEYDAARPPGTRNFRRVSWIKTDVQRSSIDQDLLFSLGGAATVFRVSRNNAEQRIEKLLGTKSASKKAASEHAGLDSDDVVEAENTPDLGQLAQDRLDAYIKMKFAGHDFARLVEGILRAQGYQTLFSKPGKDGGVDVLAGKGPLGFEQPLLCVQVKSGNDAAGTEIVQLLQAAMHNHGASHGLLVSAAGFKQSVSDLEKTQFFRIRLWNMRDVIRELTDSYEKLSAELQADIPLMRVWTLVEETS